MFSLDFLIVQVVSLTNLGVDLKALLSTANGMAVVAP